MLLRLGMGRCRRRAGHEGPIKSLYGHPKAPLNNPWQSVLVPAAAPYLQRNACCGFSLMYPKNRRRRDFAR